MKVACIIPVVNCKKNIPYIDDQLNDLVLPAITKLGATGVITVKYPGADFNYIVVNQMAENIPKGKIIIDSIKGCAEVPDIVIVCDGSKKIPFKYIIDIFRTLVSDVAISCVMANRGENKNITKDRWLIERFEVFTICKHFGHKNKISDGQCGLWTYKHGKIKIDGVEKEIKLTSNGYEIELDLLGEVIGQKLGYSFVDVELPKIDKLSGFTQEDHITKMKFLLGKHNELSKNIRDHMVEFEKETDTTEFKTEWDEYKEEIVKLI